MKVRAGGVRAGELHAVRDGAVLTIRVEQPAPLRGGQRCDGEPVQHQQQLLVHHGDLPQTGHRQDKMMLLRRYANHNQPTNLL